MHHPSMPAAALTLVLHTSGYVFVGTDGKPVLPRPMAPAAVAASTVHALTPPPTQAAPPTALVKTGPKAKRTERMPTPKKRQHATSAQTLTVATPRAVPRPRQAARDQR